jgi:Xaa-Pro aminopeptidase
MYLANFWLSPFVFRSNDAGAVLLLGRDGTSTLLADNILEPFCAQAYVREVISPVWYRGVASAPHRPEFLVLNALDLLRRTGGKRLGMEPSSLPAGIVLGLVGSRADVEFIDIEGILVQQRRCKDADELAILKKSMLAVEAGMRAGMREIRPGMTEHEAFVLVEAACQAALTDPVLVYGDFVSGPRCEKIGGPPSDRVIRAGDLVLLDFSAVVYNYRSDVANTFVVGGGRPTDRQQALFVACMEAMRAGESRLKPNIPAREVDQAARGNLAAKGLAGEHCPSHIGHGLGLGHPEAPFIVPDSSDTLMVGDVVTLEPGQYHAGIGGMRFEHNYLITQTGFERLSHHPLGLSLEQAMS